MNSALSAASAVRKGLFAVESYTNLTNGHELYARQVCFAAFVRFVYRDQEGFDVKWVTREHVHVDRVACPWLIRRFIDQNAVFEFVSRDTDAASIQDGTPFDMQGVELGHHDGKCSFEAIIAKYGLTDPVLLAMADIVHGADVEQDRGRRPESAGLEALATGFRLLCHDDHETLDFEFPVYDALYAYLENKLDSQE